MERESTKTPGEGKTGKILVVDDEQGFRDLLSFELQSQGYKVVTAVNGEEAIDKIEEENFQLIITDVKMPKKDGIEVLAAAKKKDPTTAVLMTTGYGTVPMAVSAMQKGAYDFLQKPYDIKMILTLVEKALDKNELETLVALYEASKAVFSTLHLDDLVRMILSLSVKALRAEHASILMPVENESLAPVVPDDFTHKMRELVRRIGGKKAAEVGKQWFEPVIVKGSLKTDPRFRDIEVREDALYAMACPIATHNKFLGVLNVNRLTTQEPFGVGDLRSATVFVNLAAQAIENALTHEELMERMGELERTYNELRNLKSQLIVADRLSSIGTLTAGVAHEINNPLTVIIGNSELLMGMENMSSRALELLCRVKEQGMRCRNIVRDLLKFSRRAEERKRPTCMNQIVKETVRLIAHELKASGVSVRLDLEEALPKIVLDGSHLQQVVLNLLVNARDACSGVSKPSITIETKLEQDSITLRCVDNGRGIPDEVLGRMFDPFFSTKEVGKGTGLGLSVSFGLVEQNGGTMWAESGRNGGAIMSVKFPRSLGEETRSGEADGTVAVTDGISITKEDAADV